MACLRPIKQLILIPVAQNETRTIYTLQLQRKEDFDKAFQNKVS